MSKLYIPCQHDWVWKDYKCCQRKTCSKCDKILMNESRPLSSKSPIIQPKPKDIYKSDYSLKSYSPVIHRPNRLAIPEINKSEVRYMGIEEYQTFRKISGAEQIHRGVLTPASSGSMGGGVAAGCTSPTGIKWSESFDGTNECTAGYTSNCINSWTVISGTPDYDQASPGSPPPDTACTYSCNISASASADYIRYDYGSNWADNVTTTDIYAYVYVASATIDNATSIGILESCQSTTISWYPAKLEIGQNSGIYWMRGVGSTNSATQNITIPGWYKIQLHIDATEANCYFELNDGGHQSFTCFNYANRYFMFGSLLGNGTGESINISLGVVYVD